MDLATVGTHDQVIRMQTTTCRTTMCVRSHGKDTKLSQEQALKDETEQERGIVEKELITGRVPKDMTEERKEARTAPRAANLIGTVTKRKDPMEAKAKAKGKVRAKPDIATIPERRSTSE